MAESEGLAAYEESIEQIIVFWWNRTYPADVYLDLDLSRWERKERYEFPGTSHEKITECSLGKSKKIEKHLLM